MNETKPDNQHQSDSQQEADEAFRHIPSNQPRFSCIEL